MKEDKYKVILQQHNFDNAVAQADHVRNNATTALPERSRSKAVRDRDHRGP